MFKDNKLLESSIEDIYELALAIWKMEQRIEKIASNLTEIQIRGFKSTLDKMKHYLLLNSVDYKDYDDLKYNEGMNLEIIAVEKDISIDLPIIKETIEPSIFHKGQLIKRAKVIVARKDGEEQ